jgi:hypothetical protein
MSRLWQKPIQMDETAYLMMIGGRVLRKRSQKKGYDRPERHRHTWGCMSVSTDMPAKRPTSPTRKLTVDSSYIVDL